MAKLEYGSYSSQQQQSIEFYLSCIYVKLGLRKQAFSNKLIGSMKDLVLFLNNCIHFIFNLACYGKDVKHIDKVNGFAQLTKNNYTVEFINNSGKYFMKVTWKAPVGT